MNWSKQKKQKNFKKSLNNPLSIYELNLLENNIKNALNDMKIKFEKESILEKENEISPPINKLINEDVFWKSLFHPILFLWFFLFKYIISNMIIWCQYK